MKRGFLIILAVFTVMFLSSNVYSAGADAVGTQKNNNRVMPASNTRVFQRPGLQAITTQNQIIPPFDPIILRYLDGPSRKARTVSKVLAFFKGEGVSKQEAVNAVIHYKNNSISPEVIPILAEVLSRMQAADAAIVLGNAINYNGVAGGTTLDDLAKVLETMDPVKAGTILVNMTDTNTKASDILSLMDPAKANTILFSTIAFTINNPAWDKIITIFNSIDIQQGAAILNHTVDTNPGLAIRIINETSPGRRGDGGAFLRAMDGAQRFKLIPR